MLASRVVFRPTLFARFCGAMGPSDSLKTYMSGVRQSAISDRPAPCDVGVSRGPRRPAGGYPGAKSLNAFTGFRLRGIHERLAGYPLAGGVAYDVAFPLSEQERRAKKGFRSSMGGLRVPLSTLHPRCCHRRRMTQKG
jgi:hypothetical protein